jgi:hypothetical protein
MPKDSISPSDNFPSPLSSSCVRKTQIYWDANYSIPFRDIITKYDRT